MIYLSNNTGYESVTWEITEKFRFLSLIVSEILLFKLSLRFQRAAKYQKKRRKSQKFLRYQTKIPQTSFYIFSSWLKTFNQIRDREDGDDLDGITHQCAGR